MKKNIEVYWLDAVNENNFLAAQSYLSLLFSEKITTTFVEKLRLAPIMRFQSKDIFRAAALPSQGVSQKRVRHDRKKIKAQTPFSPILLVRHQGRLIVADGYHRLCAIFGVNEQLAIECKLV